MKVRGKTKQRRTETLLASVRCPASFKDIVFLVLKFHQEYTSNNKVVFTTRTTREERRTGLLHPKRHVGAGVGGVPHRVQRVADFARGTDGHVVRHCAVQGFDAVPDLHANKGIRLPA